MATQSINTVSEPLILLEPSVLLAKFKRSAVLTSLFQEAEKSQGGTIRLKYSSECKRGRYISDLGTILINPTIPFSDKISILVFEFLNPCSKASLDQIEKARESGLITTGTEYALAIEKIEYNNILKYWQLRDQCKLKEGWAFPKYFNRPPRSFEDYLKSQAKNHTAFYIAVFDAKNLSN